MEHISAFSPNMVLIAGDLVNKHKTLNKEADKFLDALTSLSVPVYYSAGNHELSLTEKFPDSRKNYFEKLPGGVCFLDNDSVLFQKENSICITGLSLPKEFYKKGRLYGKPEDLPEISIPEHKFHILGRDIGRVTAIYDFAVIEPNAAIAERTHGGDIVTYIQNSNTLLLELLELLETLGLEAQVTDTEDLVHDQNLGIHIDGAGES